MQDYRRGARLYSSLIATGTESMQQIDNRELERILNNHAKKINVLHCMVSAMAEHIKESESEEVLNKVIDAAASRARHIHSPIGTNIQPSRSDFEELKQPPTSGRRPIGPS